MKDGIRYVCNRCGRAVCVFVAVRAAPACSKCNRRMTAPGGRDKGA